MHALLEWSSAEVWLYILSKGLYINNGYKKGNSRVGCLCCPLAAEGISAWFRIVNYGVEFNKYLSIIKEMFVDDLDNDSYIQSNIWTQRYSGRDLKIRCDKHFIEKSGEIYKITVQNMRNTWQEWRKTLSSWPCELINTENNGELTVTFPAHYLGITESKFLKIALLKSSYCVGCRTCEANCPHGALRFKSGRVTIDGCKRCNLCHSIDDGCLFYRSIRKPKEEKMKKENINKFETYSITDDWFTYLFRDKEKFFSSSGLGPKQWLVFKRILKLAGITAKSTPFSNLFYKLFDSGGDVTLGWQLFFVNSACGNPQIKWYIKNMQLDTEYSKEELSQSLESIGVGDESRVAIINAFCKICDLEFGRLIKFGRFDVNSTTAHYTRTRPTSPDSRVYLYGLYKFAEALDGYYEIPLGRLLDFEKESAGISPSEIFALSREETSQYLRGLAQNYPDFVPSFIATHGLEILYLNPDKTSDAVLELFA